MKRLSLNFRLALLFVAVTDLIALVAVLTSNTVHPDLSVLEQSQYSTGGTSELPSFFLLAVIVPVNLMLLLNFLPAYIKLRKKSVEKPAELSADEKFAAKVYTGTGALDVGAAAFFLYAVLFLSGIIPLNLYVLAVLAVACVAYVAYGFVKSFRENKANTA